MVVEGANVLHHVKGERNCPGGGNARGHMSRGYVQGLNDRIPVRVPIAYCTSFTRIASKSLTKAEANIAVSMSSAKLH